MKVEKQGRNSAPVIQYAPMAVFADDFILMIARNLRRVTRMKKAAKSPIVDGRVLKFRTDEGDFHRLRPVVEYEYDVNGENQYGFAVGFSLNVKGINQIGDRVEDLHHLKVRTSPVDPTISRLLNQDNPSLPFEVDHNAF